MRILAKIAQFLFFRSLGIIQRFPSIWESFIQQSLSSSAVTLKSNSLTTLAAKKISSLIATGDGRPLWSSPKGHPQGTVTM